MAGIISRPNPMQIMHVPLGHDARVLATLLLSYVTSRFILYQGPENEEVGIPSNVRDVDECAFFGYKLLARLVLKEGLERIGVAAFHSCESLTEVRIPSTVRVIDDDAFQSCSSLAKLILNEGLERIGSGSFCHCDSLPGFFDRSGHSINCRRD
eukprot:scaffold10821_cov68-Cylindrotheca_fusiformis.AAC.1